MSLNVILRNILLFIFIYAETYIARKCDFQVNCLQQMQNIASYGFLKKKLETHNLHIHSLWFDIYTGDIYYFSRQNKRFVEINERTLDMLTNEVNRYYS